MIIIKGMYFDTEIQQLSIGMAGCKATLSQGDKVIHQDTSNQSGLLRFSGVVMGKY
jgi:hypothetical protein